MLNLGSSTKKFRTITQPHIQSHVVEPIEQMGVDMVHGDLKIADGIDLAGDILDPEYVNLLAKKNFRSIACFNMLQCVPNPKLAAENLEKIVGAGGIIFVSVSNSYPDGRDPIDNGLRPSVEDLSLLFSSSTMIEGRILKCETFLDELLERPERIFKHFVKLIIPYPNFSYWRITWLKNKWLFRPYKVTFAIFTVNDG